MSKKPLWFHETRPQFLVLSIVLVLHGSMLAYWQGHFHWVRFFLTMAGLLFLHASVNVLNDWHDHKSGIDFKTKPTPFSGGSGMLVSEKMTPNRVLIQGIAYLLLGVSIGLGLSSWVGWELLVIGTVGAFCVVAYTPLLSHVWLGEIFAGLGLGALPVVGAYFVMAGEFSTAAWVSSIPAFLLTYNLLLLNEIPDRDADASGGRRTMPILLGKRNAGILYTIAQVGVYLSIVVGWLASVLTPWALLGLGSVRFSYMAVKGALTEYDSFEELIPAQGGNVAAVLSTNLLLAIGYFVAGLIA